MGINLGTIIGAVGAGLAASVGDIADAAALGAAAVASTQDPPAAPPPPAPPAQSPPPGQAAVDPFTVGRLFPDQFGVPTNSVLNLIDTLNRPPPFYLSSYLGVVNATATMLGMPTPPAPDHVITIPAVDPELGNNTPSSDLPPTQSVSDEETNQVNAARNFVFDFMNKVGDFVTRAKNAGYSPPANPFTQAQRYNVGRVGFAPVVITADAIQQIYTSVITYTELIAAEREGKLNLNSSEKQGAQLNHVTVSMDGYGGSGDVVLDLAKLLPSADEVKSQKSLEALAALDFTKRIPDVMFTAQYSPDGVRRGVLVGWKKIGDASGYTVIRRNVFTGEKISIVRTNQQLIDEMKMLKPYVDSFVASFYDKLHAPNLLYCLDTNAPPDAYLFYQLQAYQVYNGKPGSIFSVDTSPVFFTQAQKDSLRAQLLALEPGVKTQQVQTTTNASVHGFSVALPTTTTTELDVISPYPVLSQFLFGDAKYDWLLAGLNVRESVKRQDDRTTTRSYSYLTAQLSFLFSQADAGKFVAPKNKDFTPALNNVNSSIVKFGVSQTLQEVLQETGAFYTFDGEQPTGKNSGHVFPSLVSVANKALGQAQPVAKSAVVEIVEGCIDPENATLDLQRLSSNMAQLVAGQFVSTAQSLTQGSFPQTVKKEVSPAEISIPTPTDPQEKTTAVAADSEIEFLGKLGDLSQVVDLTTSEGISVFMRAIRVMADIGPGRGAPLFSTSTPAVADPFVPPPPPVITLSHENPITTIDDSGQATTTQGQEGLASTTTRNG